MSKTISGAIAIGKIAPLIPKMKNMLNMFDPSTLPTTIPLSPFLSAVTEVTSSGYYVPIATILRPIRASLIPKTLAM